MRNHALDAISHLVPLAIVIAVGYRTGTPALAVFFFCLLTVLIVGLLHVAVSFLSENTNGEGT